MNKVWDIKGSPLLDNLCPCKHAPRSSYNDYCGEASNENSSVSLLAATVLQFPNRISSRKLLKLLLQYLSAHKITESKINCAGVPHTSSVRITAMLVLFITES